MRLGESRLVNAGLVCADATERIEIRKDPSAIDLQAIVRHEPIPFPMNGSWQTCKKRRLEQTPLEAWALPRRATVQQNQQGCQFPLGEIPHCFVRTISACRKRPGAVLCLHTH